MKLKNKIALVTGGANGLGFAYATELLRNGVAHVAIFDLANSNGEEAASKLNDEFGQGKAIFAICDVTKPEELEAGFARTVKEFGGLDIVINNAGIMDETRWDVMINVNCNGVIHGTLLGLRYMGKNRGCKGGTIVNVASLAGLIPVSCFPIYCGTKHAIIGFSRSFAKPYHFERTGVRILTMCPSTTETQIVTQCAERMLDIIGVEALNKDISGRQLQSVDSVARGMVHIIQFGENGSVWLAENDEPVYEIEIPNQPMKKLPTKNEH